MVFKYFRRKHKKTKKHIKSVSDRVTKLERQVKLRKPEVKVDRGFVDTTTYDAGQPQLICLNPMVQGVGIGQRISDKITMLEYEIALYLESQDDLGYEQYVRYLILMCKNPHGNAPSMKEIFNAYFPYTNTVYNYSTVNFKRDYHVYIDKKVRLSSGRYKEDQQGPTGTDADFYFPNQSSHRAYQCHHKIKLNAVTDYSLGTAGTYADIDTNALYLCIFTDASSPDTMAFDYSDNLFYYDS